MVASSARTGNGRGATASSPLWLPAGVTFGSLPSAAQQAVLTILNPLYQQLVLEKNDALERGQGLSYCQLAFLEIMATYGVVGRAVLDWSRLPVSKGLTALMGVTGQKNKVASFLLTLRKFHGKVEGTNGRTPEAEAKPSGSLEKDGSC
jgi:hypothetical protein